MKKILVIGGTGFLGKSLQKKLSFESVGREFTFSETDLQKMNDADVIVFMATDVGGLYYSSEHSFSQLLNNSELAVKFFKSIRDYSKRIVVIGSACEYPDDVNVPTNETDIFNGLPAPTNEGYGIGKRLLWHFSKILIEKNNANICYLRLTNLYGEGDDLDIKKNHVIPALISKALKNDIVEVHGIPDVTRDFLYVDDAADVIIKAINSDFVGDYNIGTGNETSMIDLCKIISHSMQKGIIWKFNNSNKYGQKRRCLNIDKANEVIKWKPNVSLEEGIVKTIKYIKNHESIN